MFITELLEAFIEAAFIKAKEDLKTHIRNLEFKRGLADARAGIRPALLAGPYVEGYIQAPKAQA